MDQEEGKTYTMQWTKRNSTVSYQGTLMDNKNPALLEGNQGGHDEMSFIFAVQ
jgi:hypothetical protein